MQDFTKILENKLRNLKEQLETTRAQDPYNREDYANENTQDDDASEREEHARVEAIEEDLTNKIKAVQEALEKQSKGTYGTCESCGNKIDNARLEALPEAKLCISCQRRQ